MNIPDGLAAFYLQHRRDARYLLLMDYVGEERRWRGLRIYQPGFARRYNAEMDVDQRLPGWFVIGDDSGEELVCFNVASGKVALIPCFPMRAAAAVHLAHSLDELVAWGKASG